MTVLSSLSVDVVPASMDMALTPISIPETCLIPTLALQTLSRLSPSSMPLRPWMAMSVTAGSAYSQNAMPFKLLAPKRNGAWGGGGAWGGAICLPGSHQYLGL